VAQESGDARPQNEASGPSSTKGDSERLTRMEVTLDGVRSDVSKITRVVIGDGNGQIGLVRRLDHLQDDVERLGTRMEELEDEREEERAERMWLRRTLVAALVGAACTVAVAMTVRMIEGGVEETRADDAASEDARDR